MNKTGMSLSELAKQCGLKRQTVYENIQRADVGTQQRGIFPLMVLRLALKNGLEAEALAVLFGGYPSPEIPTLARAGILYPDLTPDELLKLRKAEEVTCMSSLPTEVIKSVIEKSRS